MMYIIVRLIVTSIIWPFMSSQKCNDKDKAMHSAESKPQHA